MSPLISGTPEEFPGLAPPAEAEQVVRENIFTLEPIEGFLNTKLSDAAGQRSVGLSKAYELYEAGLESAGRDVLALARFRGWYYLVYSGDKPICHLEMSVLPDRSARPRRIGGGTWVEALVDECRFLESLGQVRRTSAVLRYIRVWSLSIFAFWVHFGGTGKNDLVVPLPPTGKDLMPAPHTLYSRDSFVALVKDIAQDRLGSGLNVIGSP